MSCWNQINRLCLAARSFARLFCMTVQTVALCLIAFLFSISLTSWGTYLPVFIVKWGSHRAENYLATLANAKSVKFPITSPNTSQVSSNGLIFRQMLSFFAKRSPCSPNILSKFGNVKNISDYSWHLTQRPLAVAVLQPSCGKVFAEFAIGSSNCSRAVFNSTIDRHAPFFVTILLADYKQSVRLQDAIIVTAN